VQYCRHAAADRQTDRHTPDTQTRVTTIHFSWSSTHAKCNKYYDQNKAIQDSRLHTRVRHALFDSTAKPHCVRRGIYGRGMSASRSLDNAETVELKRWSSALDLRCLPLTDIPRPYASPYTMHAVLCENIIIIIISRHIYSGLNTESISRTTIRVEKITVRQRCSSGEKVLSLNAVQRQPAREQT